VVDRRTKTAAVNAMARGSQQRALRPLAVAMLGFAWMCVALMMLARRERLEIGDVLTGGGAEPKLANPKKCQHGWIKPSMHRR
jgi:hypothetical protein